MQVFKKLIKDQGASKTVKNCFCCKIQIYNRLPVDRLSLVSNQTDDGLNTSCSVHVAQLVYH